MLPVGEVAGPLQKPGQRREHRRRVPLGGGRLADGQPHLPHGHGETSGRIHHHEHLLPLGLEILGDGGGDIGPPHPHQRRLVRCGNHHHRFFEPFLLQILFDELAQFPAPLADQGDDIYVGFSIARDHAEQGRLTHPGAGHDSHPLPFAAGQKAVDGADPQIERFPDGDPRHRVNR